MSEVHGVDGGRFRPSVMVPMRDGTRLSTDLYIPATGDGPFPVILMRTPYDKNAWRNNRSWEVPLFVEHGYVVAVQDVRGKFESEGQFFLSGADRQDGDDALSWLAKQSWSTGRVGTYGCSYLGENQLQLATQRNPHHACMLPKAAPGAADWFGMRTGGAVDLADALSWFAGSGATIHPQLPAGLDDETTSRVIRHYRLEAIEPEFDLEAASRMLPIVEILNRVGAPPTDYEEFVSRELTDPWWERCGYVTSDDRIDVPALLVDSWYDYGPGLTLDLFNRFRATAISERARQNQFVVIAPTTHCAFERASEQTIVGARDLGDARFEYAQLYLRWFDHWLKEQGTDLSDLSPIQLYVMGRNRWRGEETWPLPRTEWTRWHLRGDGRANSRFGDGWLSPEPPDDELGDNFIYDPATPVPTVGSAAGAGGTTTGSFDQSLVETRHDVLVYTSPPLERDLEVTGPLEVVLYVSSSARDTDFTAKLVDVYPDGRAFNIRDSIVRTRYRAGFDRKEWMSPGEVYELRIGLGATSNVFLAGHRIRLDISSSNFPCFDRNLNTGGNNWDETEWVVARNTIHHSAAYPSHIVLPVISD